MIGEVHIAGFEDAKAVLDELPTKFQAQVVKKIFKDSLKPVVKDAKSRLLNHNPAHKRLASAIGFIPLRTQAPIVIVGVRAKGKYKDVGFMGHWIEYGVSGIKRGHSRNLTRDGDDAYRTYVARVKVGERYRRDMPPQPFMRPAVDSKKGTIQQDVAEKFGEKLHIETERALKRHMKKSKGVGALYARAKNRRYG